MIASNALAKFEGYIDDVMHGNVIVGEHVRASIDRHQRDIERQDAPDFHYVFDANAAIHNIDFFPMVCRHSIGEYATLPFELEPWQAFVVGSIFGWKRLDGTRRFRKVYVGVGRKNGKSTLLAALIHKLAMADINPFTRKPEAVAEIVLTAPKKDQSAVIFNEAKRMREQSADIKKLSNTKYNQISYTHNQSSIRISSSDRPLSGLNPHAVIMDELHEWKEQNRKFYDTMITGFGSRMQPLHIIITTAGDDHSDLWIEEHDYAIEVVHGRYIDNRVFVFSAELDKDDDPFDETNWPKANPNLGISVKLETLRESANEMKRTITGVSRFTRYHGNRQVSAIERAFDIDSWDRCKGDISDWQTADCICYGIDLGGRDDLASYGAVARWTMGFDAEDKPQYRYECKSRSFISSDTLRDLDTQPWVSWLHEGYLTKADFVTTRIKSALIEAMEADNASQVAYDKFAAQQLAEELTQEGFQPIDFKQSCAMYNEPIREFLDCIAKRTIGHNGDPVLRWAVGNMSIVKNSDDQWKPDKKHSKDKIDPIVSVLMAFRLAMVQPVMASGSKIVY